MANSPGRFGAYFKTKVVILNPTDFSYSIHATLYNSKGLVSTIVIEMGSKEYKTWYNFLDEVFGYRGAGAVEFDSWFDPPGGSSDFGFSVYAEVYTDSPNGRFSTVVVDGEGAEDIRIGYGRALEGGVFINAGITSNSEQRVNVGLFNDSFSEKNFFARVFDAEGNLLETIDFEVPVNGWTQRGVSARFENGYITWRCLEETCSAYPWVVTVNNRSNDGQLAQPVVYVPD